MTTYDYENLFEPEVYDDFRRKDWILYGTYWLITGNSAQEYVNTVSSVKQKVRKSIDDVLDRLLD